jgi:ABC-2 type transport system permease protein
MFRDIFVFELKYRLKRPATYVYAAVMLGVGVLYGAILAGVMGVSTAESFGGGPQILSNAPVLIHTILVGSISVFGTFIVAAFMAVPVYRDFRYDAHSLFFTKPINKLNYLAGRYAGSMVITLATLLLTGIGLAVMLHWPYETPPKLGPFNLWHYLYPYLVSIIPYALLAGSIFFAAVSLTRNQLFIYLNAIIILVLFNVASSLANTIDNKTIGLLIDPTGSVPLNDAFLFWSTAEKNSQVVPFTGTWMWNLLIWQLVGLGILAFTYFKFELSYSRPKLIRTPVKVKDDEASPGSLIGLMEAVKLPVVQLTYAGRDRLQQLWMLTRMELKRFFRSPVFWAIIGFAVLLLVLIQFINVISGITQIPVLPVTYNMIDNINGAMALFIYALIIFFTGELIWRERQSRVNELYDVMPVPNWLGMSAKMLALISIPFIVLGIGILIGIIIQLSSGYFRIELGQYLLSLFGFRMIDYLLFLVLCVFIQVLVNNKFAGFFICVLAFAAFRIILPGLGVDDRLWLYMSGYRLTYSDMNGFGPFVKPFLSYKLYWAGLGLILLTIASVLYPRGTDFEGKTRLLQLRENLKPSSWITISIGAVIFLGMGSYIFYNTHVLNEFTTSDEGQEQQAQYERKYKQYENMRQPRITSIKMDIDLYPEERDFEVKGWYQMTNKHDTPIDTLHVLASTMEDLEIEDFRFSRSQQEILHDDSMDIYFFLLDEPLLPGDTMEMNFTGAFRTQGFANRGLDTRVVENGTFFNSFIFPQFGYQPAFEIGNPDLRKEKDLPPKVRFPERTDTAALMNTLFARDADWINFEATLSTDPDQIAIAPGYLEREWEENGRRYFHYKMDKPMVKFYNIISARYEVMRDTFVHPQPDSKLVNLEIYYHPDHTYNLDSMMAGMKHSLRIYTRDFGPYQFRQVRILEFPRYASFAQSFANTIPSSEGVGFIANADKGDINYPVYLAAHEIAHQWWGHQVVSGNAKGFQFLIESMAQYSSILLIEEVLGEEKLRDYIKQERNTYLRSRSAESREEMPLMEVEQQFYIQYQKGSLAMYALKDYLGRDTLNKAIRAYLNRVKFQEPPYTTTLEWMEEVEKVTPDSLKYVLTDLFETITFHENEMLEATYRMNEDSTYTINMKIRTHKLRDDGKGNETAADPHALIDVGVFARKKVDGKREEVPLYLQKHWFDQDTTEMTLVVEEEPSKVSIDPYGKLIDRKLGNNSKSPTEETEKETQAETIVSHQ